MQININLPPQMRFYYAHIKHLPGKMAAIVVLSTTTTTTTTTR